MYTCLVVCRPALSDTGYGGDHWRRKAASDAYVVVLTGVAPRSTVSSQTTSVYRKLGVSSRSDAVASLRDLGLLVQ
jgi:hypothetical protein